MAEAWFVIASGAGGFAAGNGNIRGAERRQKTVDLVDRHGEIRIGDHAVLAVGLQYAAPDGAAFAGQVFVQDAQPGEGSGKFPGHCEGAVLAAVFHHQHFGGVGLFFQECKDLPQGAGQAGLFISSRDDNGEERRHQENGSTLAVLMADSSLLR